MERLTAWDGKHAYVKQCFENDCKGTTGADVSKCINCRHYAKAYDRLGAYEDTEEQGRLVELPCKIGDAVYWPSLYTSGVNDGCVTAVRISRFGFDLELLVGGRFAKRPAESVFLTREEAEAALANEHM